MLSAKLAEEMEEEEPAMEEEEETEPAMEEGEGEETHEEPAMEEGEEMPAEEPAEEEMPEEDDDLDLDEIIKELEGEESEEEPTMEGEESEETHEEEPTMEGEESDDEEINIDEIIKSLREEEEEGKEEMKEEEEKEEESSEELEEAYNVIRFLKGKINEVNLLNAKLLYSNKLFRNFTLSEGQKMKVIENFDRAFTLREVKLVYSTLAESFKMPSTKKIVKEWPKPPFFDAYVGMDLGFVDLTVVVFGYYDFRAAKIIIEDEIVIKGSDLHLPSFADKILETEKRLWSNPLTNEMKQVRRVSDINYIVTKEISIFLEATVPSVSASIDLLCVESR